MRIREAEETDAAKVTALWTEAYADAGPEGRREPYALQEYFTVAAGAAVTVVEDDDGELVGVVALYPGRPHGRGIAGPSEAELARLAVAERAQRHGVGRMLVERCTSEARSRGAVAVVLWSRPYQTDAHRLYESLGYRRDPWNDGEDAGGRRWVFRLDIWAGRSPRRRAPR
jgi:ribosomal protein S18 acetylase RimI-like enzyme